MIIRKLAFLEINENLTQAAATSQLNQEDEIIVSATEDITPIIEELIEKTCKQHPIVTVYSQKWDKEIPQRDPKTKDYIYDTTKYIYNMTKAYQMVGSLLGFHIGYDEWFSIKPKKDKKGSHLVLSCSKQSWNNFYGSVWKKLSEIDIDEHIAHLINQLKTSKIFEDPSFIPYYAKVLGGAFMKYGDTLSKKREYKDEPTNFNLSNINRGFLSKNYNPSEAAQKLREFIDNNKNINENLTQTAATPSFDFDKKADSYLNLFEIFANYIREKGELYDEHETEYDLAFNRPFPLKGRMIDFKKYFGALKQPYIRESSGCYLATATFKEDGTPKGVYLEFEPDYEWCFSHNVDVDDWYETFQFKFDKDLNKDEQLQLLKEIGVININENLTASAATTQNDWKDEADAEILPYVDLGTSVKWCRCNLGAKTETEIGDYYGWGKTEPYQKTDNTYDYLESDFDFSIDSDLDEEHDAATQKLGKGYRLPTAQEMEELNDKCDMELVKNGLKIMNRSDHRKYILLPYSGRQCGTERGCFDNGWYNTKSYIKGNGMDAYRGAIDSYASLWVMQSTKHIGIPIRAVYTE